MTALDPIPYRLINLAEERVSRLLKIVIEHPRMVEAHCKFETLIAHAHHNPNDEKHCMPMIAPTGTGKTTIVDDFVRKKNTPLVLSEQRIPILHVTLKPPATRKTLARDILIAMREFGFETAPDVGTEDFLQERVRVLLDAAKVELLVVDEFQHLVLSKNENVARTVGDTLKWMLIKGVCPIVISGTEDALKPFKANSQLVRRAIPGVNLAPLSRDSKDDRTLYIRFLGKLLREMECREVARNALSLLNDDVPGCLLETSGGVLGKTCSFLEDTVRLMTLAGREEFIRDDLVLAGDAFQRDGKCETTPFRDGLAPLRIAA